MNFTLSNTGFFFFKYIWALCCDAVMYLQLSSIDFWNCFWTVPRLAQCSLFSLELIRHHFCGNTLLWTLRSLPCIGRSHAAGQNPKTLPALCALHFLSHLFLAVLSPLSVSLHTHPDGFLANDSRDPLQISTPCLPLCTSLLPGTLPCKFSRVLSSVFSNQWDQQMLWVFLPYLHAGYSHPTVNWSTFMASLIHVPLSGDHCSVLPVFQGPKPIFSRSCVVFYLISAWG